MKVIVTEIAALREIIKDAKLEGQKIGLVPTMGYLHDGHLTLVKQACKNNDLVVVSIFVNPIQFGPNEDYESYPRDLARDSQLAFKAGAAVIFAPTVQEMYPDSNFASVEVAVLGENLCGSSRPGHFRGVTTVVSKLFNIVQPDQAFFGEKDAQQLAIIKRMVQDLNFPVQIVPVPIVRESDGLALSSRNVYLSSEQREKATVLYRSLLAARDAFKTGERDSSKIKQLVTDIISEVAGAQIEYVEITDTEKLQPVQTLGKSSLVALAVRFGITRLIDNITLMEDQVCSGI